MTETEAIAEPLMVPALLLLREGLSLHSVRAESLSMSVPVTQDPWLSTLTTLDSAGYCSARLLVGLVLVEGDALLELSTARVSVAAGPVDPGSVEVDITVDVVSLMLGTGKSLWLS